MPTGGNFCRSCRAAGRRPSGSSAGRPCSGFNRTGAPWRDLPRQPFGRWANARRGFERWTKSGLLARIFARLRELHGTDAEALYLDSTAAKAHRHAAGARKSLGPQAIGTSRGGRGTKVHAVCDALGYPLAVKLSAAQEADVSHA